MMIIRDIIDKLICKFKGHDYLTFKMNTCKSRTLCMRCMHYYDVTKHKPIQGYRTDSSGKRKRVIKCRKCKQVINNGNSN